MCGKRVGCGKGAAVQAGKLWGAGVAVPGAGCRAAGTAVVCPMVCVGPN